MDTLLNPTILIEVLFASTELYDRGKKAINYRTIESLAEYLLVAQDEHRVEQYVKQANGHWLLTDIRGASGVVELAAVGCALSLQDIYDKVQL